MQICGKNLGLHPCGEVQLTLHLPDRRQTGTQLAALAADSVVNPNLAAWRGPGPLIHQEKEAGERAEEADRAGRRADRRGEVRVDGFSFGGGGRGGASLIPTTVSRPPRLPLLTICEPRLLTCLRLAKATLHSFNCYCFLPTTIETYKSRSSPAVAAGLPPSEEVRGKEPNVNKNTSIHSDSLGKRKSEHRHIADSHFLTPWTFPPFFCFADEFRRFGDLFTFTTGISRYLKKTSKAKARRIAHEE